jgi:hypothetical protein
MGHPVSNWAWDTMLAAHIYNNQPDITSVKFQAYVLLGVPGYESALEGKLKAKGGNKQNHIDEIHPYDLLLYCGVDSLVEHRVGTKQKELLGWA